jgi:hypothetical protein
MFRPMIVVATVVGMSAGMAGAGVQTEWLSLGSKRWAPTVVSKSGIGTANARVQAKVTRQEIEGWCASWSPGDKDCARRELASDEAKMTYSASADCVHGRITAVDGNTYTLAGKWDHSDVGGGRTRWRDNTGKIVGRDNASGGLSISQQWEVLCPGSAKTGHAARSNAERQTTPPVPNVPFAVGQVVEARYGRQWVRGRIDRIRQIGRGTHSEIAYDVRLENGQRGLLPARMLRPAPRSQSVR